MFRAFLTLHTNPSLRIRSKTFRKALVTRSITASLLVCGRVHLLDQGEPPSVAAVPALTVIYMDTGGSDLALSKSTRSMTFLAPKFKVGGNVKSLIWFYFLLNFTSINVLNVKIC